MTKRWKKLKKDVNTNEDERLKYKGFQTLVNKMYVVEYDSDYIHSGDEETNEQKKE